MALGPDYMKRGFWRRRDVMGVYCVQWLPELDVTEKRHGQSPKRKLGRSVEY